MADRPDSDDKSSNQPNPGPEGKPAAPARDPLAAYRSASDPERMWRIVDTALATATTLLVLAGVWLVPHTSRGLFTVLAGGRDVVDGKLAAADDWSFTTADAQAGKHAVWVNQAWLSGAAMYLTQKSLGYNGLLVLKAVLLAGIGLVLLKIMRMRGAPWKTTLLTLAFLLVCSQDYYALGTGVWTLLLAGLLIWVIYASQKTPRLAWLAAGIMLVWANAQGSFVLGLAMMVLWTLCLLISETISRGIGATLRKYWPVAAATVVALALAAFANPFGLANLTQSLAFLTDARWHLPDEWASAFQTSFNLTWLFWLGIIVTIGLGLLRLLSELVIRGGTGNASSDIIALAVFELLALTAVAIVAQTSSDNARMFYVRWGAVALALLSLLPLAFAIKDAAANSAKMDTSCMGILVFEAILGAAGIAMALIAVRFVPLALIFLAPLLAGQIAWALGRARNFAPAVGCILVLALGWMTMGTGIMAYSSQNQIQPAGTLFEHMHGINFEGLPSLTAFLNDNKVAGNALTMQEQEGQLRWFSPQVKVFSGARGRSVYSAKTLGEYEDLTGGKISWADFLARHDIHVAIFQSPSPQSPQWYGMLGMIYDTTNQWHVVYFDGINFVMVDHATESTKRLAAQAMGGRLQDSSVGDLKYSEPAVAGLSKAYCVKPRSPGVALDFLASAMSRRPMLGACNYFCEIAISLRSTPDVAQRNNVDLKLIPYLEHQASALEKLGVPPHTGLEILQCREIIYKTLALLYAMRKDEQKGLAAEDMGKKSAAAAHNAELTDKMIKEVVTKWRIAV